MTAFPAVVHWPLPGAANLWLASSRHLNTVAIELGLPIGASVEPKLGLTARLAQELSQPYHRHGLSMFTLLEQHGVELTIEPTWSSLVCSFQILPDQWPMIFEHVIRGLRLWERELANDVELAAIQDASKAGAEPGGYLLAVQALAQLLGQPAIAESELALSGSARWPEVTSADLRHFARVGMTTHGLQLVIAGDLDDTAVYGHCNRILAAWPRSRPPRRRRLQHLRHRSLWIRGSFSTVHYSLALDLRPLVDQPQGWAQLLSPLVKDRLFQQLRTPRPLAYFLHCYTVGPTLVIHAATEPRLARQVWAILEQEMAALSGNLSPEWIAQAARCALSQEWLERENSAGLAGRIFRELMLHQEQRIASRRLSAWRSCIEWLQVLADQEREPQWPEIKPADWRQVVVSSTRAGPARDTRCKIVTADAVQ